MLKNQRKDTYQPHRQSLQLPPSCRFPPLREGNRARVRFPLLAGGTLRRGSSIALVFVNCVPAIGITQLAEDEGDSSLAWQAENALRQVRETLRDAVLLPSLEAIEEILSGIPVPPPILPVWEDLLPSTWGGLEP
jgi:hypothetical protein